MKTLPIIILILLTNNLFGEDWNCKSKDPLMQEITCESNEGKVFSFESNLEDPASEYEVNDDIQLDIETFVESIGPGKSIKASTPQGDVLSGITLEGGKLRVFIEYATGDTYEGEMLGLYRHGKGKLTNSEFILEGEFVEGYLQGQGTKTFLNINRVIKGEFLDSQPDGFIEDTETFVGENEMILSRTYKGQAKAGFYHGVGRWEFNTLNEYEGVGLRIAEYTNPSNARFWIQDIVKNSPASKSKDVMIGDNIISIKNSGKRKIEAKNLTLEELTNLIAGKKGKAIEIELQRYDKNYNSQILTVRLKRDEILDEFVEIYEGRFADGVRSGYGKSSTSDGKSYEGTWKNDLWNGFGKRTWGEGNTYLGTYKDGSCEGPGMQLNQNYDIVYYGEFHKCYAHGQGGHIQHLPDGTKEIKSGQFFENKLDGYGEVTYSNGDTYKGNWEMDSPVGYGEYYNSNFRERYIGIFDDNGLMQGKGVLIKDSFKYEGNFEDGAMQGKGKMFNKEFSNEGTVWSQPRFVIMENKVEVGTYEPEKIAEERIALVIGNGAYLSSRLENSENDSIGIKRTLENKGFEVIHKTNLNQKDFKKAIWDFAEVIKSFNGNVTALFYYAGHAVQIEGDNYLIPVDSRMSQQKDVELESINAQSIINSLSQATEGVKILIMDSCRNNPFRSYSRDISGGLAQMSAPIGTFIAYSTAPGEVALDGNASGYGIYTGSLINALSIRNLTIEQVFKRTRMDVAEITNGEQIPWESSSLIGDFYFSKDQ